MGHYDNIIELESELNGDDLRIGIVMSRFNMDVGEGLLGACTAELIKRGVQESGMLLVTVPGALEIPLTLALLIPVPLEGRGKNVGDGLKERNVFRQELAVSSRVGAQHAERPLVAIEGDVQAADDAVVVEH